MKLIALSFIFLITLSACSSSQPTRHISSEENSVEGFIGSYVLIQAVKQTDATITRRPSSCRDILQIKPATQGNMLMLFGDNTNRPGSTMNWIELNENPNNVTEITPTLIKQSRFFAEYHFMGIKRREHLVTLLEKIDDQLRYTYHVEISNNLNDDIKIAEEAICIYHLK